MKNPLKYFSVIIILTIVFLSIAQVVVSNRIATTGDALVKLEDEIQSYKLQNSMLREEVLTNTSLINIASKAAMLGLMRASESELVLTSAPPLARR